MHNLRPQHPVKKKKRVGRGGKRGTTSGRGTKGQRARSGRKLRPEWRDIIKKRPKLRGYRAARSRLLQRWHLTAVVNLDLLNQHFAAGDSVTPEILWKKGIIRKVAGRLPTVKILGRGKVVKPLTVTGCILSESARRQLTQVK